MIGLLVWLVVLGFFDEIKFCFMMVGHTHDDNDQFFSHLSTFLKIKGVRTIDSLLQLIVQSHPGLAVFSQTLQERLNVRDFVDSFLLPLHNISKPLNFHFKKMEGTVKFRCRLFQDCQYSPWMPILRKDPPAPSQLSAATEIKVPS